TERGGRTVTHGQAQLQLAMLRTRARWRHGEREDEDEREHGNTGLHIASFPSRAKRRFNSDCGGSSRSSDARSASHVVFPSRNSRSSSATRDSAPANSTTTSPSMN